MRAIRDAPNMFFLTTETLNRKEAIRRLNLIVGKDLRAMADEYKIAVWKNGRKNKGWAGLVLERYLGLAQNSRQAPDFGTWDLKLVALHYARRLAPRQRIDGHHDARTDRNARQQVRG